MGEIMQCLWKKDKYAWWHSACGQSYEYITEGPGQGKNRYCPNCGKPICVSEKPYQKPELEKR